MAHLPHFKTGVKSLLAMLKLQRSDPFIVFIESTILKNYLYVFFPHQDLNVSLWTLLPVVKWCSHSLRKLFWPEFGWKRLERSSCDGQFYVSIWLGCGVSRYLVKYYSEFVWRVFPGETSIWTGELSEADCLTKGGWAPSDLPEARLEERWGKGKFTLCLFPSWALGLALHLQWTLCHLFLVVRPSGSDWNSITVAPGSPAGEQQIAGLLSLFNHTSPFL